MLIWDSKNDEQVIRIKGIERTRITKKPVHFPPNKTDAEIEVLVNDFIDSRISSDGYHAYLHIASRSPLSWSIWIGPIGIEPPINWYSLGDELING